jgi:hypothetical protein
MPSASQRPPRTALLPCRASQEVEERQAALEANRGVYLKISLAAAPTDEASTVVRGIRRWRDKLVLPPRTGAARMAQVGRERSWGRPCAASMRAQRLPAVR